VTDSTSNLNLPSGAMPQPESAAAHSTPTVTAKATPATVTIDPPMSGVTDLVLAPPAVVAVVPKEQAATMMPMDPAVAARAAAKAREWVASLEGLDPRAPEFGTKIRDVSAMGDADIRKASNVANRMLQRPLSALEAAEGRGEEGNPTRKVSGSLLNLRRTIEDLDPSQVDSGRRKILGVIPFGDKVRDYFAKYQDSQKHLDKIIESLMGGQDELRKDNAAIEGEKVNLWDTMQRLQEYAVMAKAIDASLDERIAQVALTEPEKANQLKADLLFAVRQKHQDLLTQLAVSAQSYLALDMIRKNNTELIKGVERASTTTVSALRTAIIVAQALANQKLVLDQIQALNSTTSGLIVSTSEMLKTQTGRIQEQAVSTSVSLDSLKTAFANVYATMDAIDVFKVQAVDNMAVTVDTLQTELQKATSYLDRARTSERAALPPSIGDK